MSNEKFKSTRVRPNPSTGTISGDISKFVINPLKNLFKQEEEIPKFVEGDLPIKEVSKDTIKEVIKRVSTEQSIPELEDNLVKTANLKVKFEEDKKTNPWVNSLIVATGGPVISDEARTQIGNKLIASNSNIIKINDKTFIDTATNKNVFRELGSNRITEQAMNGVLEAGYSMGQLVTMGSDFMFDTDLTTKIDKLYDDWYEKLDLEEPTDLYGQVTKTLFEYGLPFTYISKLSKPLRMLLKSKASKIASKKRRYSTKAALSIGFNAATFGAAEFIVGNKGDTIKAPFSKQYQFEDEEGKTGRDKAIARIKNKARFGFEGGKIGLTWSIAGRALPLGIRFGLKTVGTTFNIGGRVANATLFNPMAKLLSGQVPLTGSRIPYTKVTIPVVKYSDKLVPGTVKAISGGIRTGGKFALFKAVEPLLRGVKIDKTSKTSSAVGAPGVPTLKYNYQGKIPKMDDWKMFSTTSSDPFKRKLKRISNFLQYFTKEYKTPNAVYKAQTEKILNTKGENRIVGKYLEDLETRAYKLVKSQASFYNKNKISPLAIQNQLEIVTSYLKNQAKLKAIPKDLRASAEGLKKHIESLKGDYLKALPKGELRDNFADIIKSYMKKSFAVVTNPTYNPPKEVVGQAVKAFRKIMDKNKDMREDAIKDFPSTSRSKSYNQFSEAAVRTMITDYKAFTGDPIAYINNISKQLLRKDKLMFSGEELPAVFRKLLGEEKNLRSQVLQTVTDLVSQTSNKKMYDEILQIGLKNGWLKKTKGTLDTRLAKVGQLQGMGYLKSDISNYFAAPEFVQAIKGSQGVLDYLLKSSIYRGMLQYKTAVQFGKTGLSPDTQVRNVTSTPLFPLGYGWLGGKGTVDDSFKFIYQDITGAGKKANDPKFIEDVGKYIKLGGLDESIEAQELLAVVRKLSENPNVIDQLMRGALQTRFLDKATQFYQAGDNVWKHYAIRWNQNNLREIFKGNIKELAKQEELITGQKYNPISRITGKRKTFEDAVDELSVWYARNLMPTYSLVPEIIRDIRLLPAGNFISWPAEILRITGTAARTALREASSTNLGIQQNGLRKLIGMSLTFGGASYVVDQVWESYTGVGQDKINAYKRSFAESYDDNAKFTAIKPLEDGILTVVNSSYADVWDYVKRPMRTFMNQIGKKQTPQQIDDTVLKAVGEASLELLQPFTTTSLGLEPLIDVLPAAVGGRGGKTKNNFSVYSPRTDTYMDIGLKSLKHIFRAAAPGFVLQGDKYAELAYDTYKERTFPGELRENVISTLTGRKIRRLDLFELLNRKAGKLAPTIKGDLTMSEGFYRASDWETRGPKQIKREFEKIQEEGFRAQQEILTFIEDARTLEIPDHKIAEVLNRRFRNKNLVSNLMYSKTYTPYKYYRQLFEDRYKRALRDTQKQNRPAPNYTYVYPIAELEKVMANHQGLDLTKSYQENMKEKESFSLPKQEKKPSPNSDENILKMLQSQEAKIKTPPLPETPKAINVATATPKVNPNTLLTRSESALLSPTEQQIRLNQRT
tara:strand:+ start:1867 stop:6405 length:4539 start_codon:yes stop_codon:yes gene_type:complete